MCIHFPQVDKPKQNGSADGDDAVQGSKQGEHTVLVFVASWYQVTHNSSWYGVCSFRLYWYINLHVEQNMVSSVKKVLKYVQVM